MSNLTASSEQPFPLVSQQSPAVDFIEHRDIDFRNIRNDVSCKFDTERQKFVARPSPQALVRGVTDTELVKSKQYLAETTERFNDAIYTLKTRKTKDVNVSNFRLGHCHDWGEVTDTIQGVVDKYYSTDTKWGKIRGAFRRVGDNAASIQGFVGLLPDGSYKTLCGGLTLVLTAMLRHSEVREKFTSLLEQLPDIVDECKQYSKIYPGRNSLLYCIHDVYVHVLLALEDMIHWYEQPKRKRMVDNVLKNESYGQSIDIRLKYISESKQRFLTETRLYAAWDIHETLATAKKVESNVQSLRDDFDKVTPAMQAMNSNIGFLVEKIRYAEWHKDIEAEREALRKANEEMANQTRILSEGKDQEIRKLKSRLEQTSFTAAYLQDFLKVDDFNLSRHDDMKLILSFGLDESISFQSRSRWISNTSEFSEWMKSSDAKALFVEGHGGFEKMSPLSFFITLLYESLLKVPDTLVLSFFCGLNTKNNRDTAMTGPMIMAKALFAQLLAQDGLESSNEADDDPPLSLLSMELVSRMCKNSHEAYMPALSQLLLKLGERYKAIFVMVDAVDFYDHEWKDELREFIRTMKGLTRGFNKQRKKRGGVGTFKLLVTASSRTTCFPSPRKSVAVVEVPEELDEEEESFEQFEQE